ncbi:MAG: hypothetical protein L6R39_000118 [Caloplaca ligustica]|nr:MAG: hypothetical protein L6R39_000118 [Caloplaca ligustica]
MTPGTFLKRPLPAALGAFRKTTFSTWQHVQHIHDNKVETFRKAALNPSLPTKLPKQSLGAVPAAAKWFQEPWPTFNNAYLGQFGDHIIPLELTQGSQFQRADAPFAIFLGWAEQASTGNLPRLYVAQAPISRLPQPLQDDLPTPELVVKAGNGDIYDASIWLGIAPTFTPLHRDPNPNLYFQLAGCKVVRLLDPDAGHSVFAAVQAELGRQGSSRFRGDEMMKGEEKALLEAKIWRDNPTEDPAEVVGVEATLEAGESMFIPQGWWHSVRSTGTGCTASWDFVSLE